MRRGAWLHEDNFEVLGDTASIKISPNGPKNARLALHPLTRRRSDTGSGGESNDEKEEDDEEESEQQERLFSSLKFYVYPGRWQSPAPSKPEVRQLIELGGGSVVASLPAVRGERRAKDDFEITILLDGVTPSEQVREIRKKYGVRPINYTWLVDSVGTYTLLDVKRYYADG